MNFMAFDRRLDDYEFWWHLAVTSMVKGVEFEGLLGEKTLELECLELVFNLLSSDKYCFTGYKCLH